MKKNDIYNITIEDIGNEGEGIGHIFEDGSDRGIAVFVKDTVIGDVVSIKIIKVKKNYAYGRLMEIITPSPYRVEARCPKARSCGGCSIMHMSYEKQLEYKWNKVKNCLERIGGIEDVASIMEPVYGMTNPYNYRNKMQFPVGLDKDGKVQIGFYAGRTHSIIDLDSCYIGHPVNDYIVKELRLWLQKWQDKTGSFIYDEEQHKGLVRHILTRVGFTTGELMVCVIINGDSLCGKGIGKEVESELLECLIKAVDEYNNSVSCGKLISATKDEEKYAEEPDVTRADNSGESGCNIGCDKGNTESHLEIRLTSLSININRDKTNRILGDRCKTIWGEDYISDYIGDVKFNISPMSFYQVNPVQTKVLYDKAVEYARLTGSETVWDMYCGIGTISLSLAKKAGKVYGVEIVPQAIEDAKANARINGFTNTEFFCGKAEEVVPEFYRGEPVDGTTEGNYINSAYNNVKHGEADGAEIGNAGAKGRYNDEGRHPDVIVVDPPRKGCDSVLLDTIEAMAPKRLVYVSCDPATLARDVKILVEKGFAVEKVAVVDQFGHSGHVESVVLMSNCGKGNK